MDSALLKETNSLALIVDRSHNNKKVGVMAGDAIRLKVAWGSLKAGEIGIVQGARHLVIEAHCQMKFRCSAYRDDEWCMVSSEETICTDPKTLKATEELALIQFWRWSSGSANANSSKAENYWMYVPLWEWGSY